MCLPLGLDPAHGGACDPCGMESPRRGPSSPVLGQQEPKRLMVTFNLPQQNRKVWSKCATLASLLKGCLWRIPFSVRKASSHPGLSRAGATHTWPLCIWRPGSRCANLPCTEEMHLLKSQIQDSSAPQPTCGTIITAFRLVFIVPIIWLIRSISDWEQE